jgi:hypothetical protein
MKTALVLIATLAIVGSAFGTAGSVIRSFTLPGQPASGARGLAYDWSDGNIWAAGPATTNVIQFGKFNPTTGSMVVNWATASGAYWVFDIGYGYQVSGTRYLVFVDQNAPRVRLFTTTGSYYGSMSDPFSGGYDEGVDCDWDGTYVYLTNYAQTPIYRWTGSSWSSFATVPATPPMGCATGWGKVFAVTTSSDYKIYQYNTSGSLEASIPLQNWGTTYMVGMSIGRQNVVGSEDSVFLAVFYPSSMIYEVSVGDVAGSGIAPSSLGKIKTLYR